MEWPTRSKQKNNIEIAVGETKKFGICHVFVLFSMTINFENQQIELIYSDTPNKIRSNQTTTREKRNSKDNRWIHAIWPNRACDRLNWGKYFCKSSKAVDDGRGTRLKRDRIFSVWCANFNQKDEAFQKENKQTIKNSNH